jgi:large-conductance mechanosensitive channel
VSFTIGKSKFMVGDLISNIIDFVIIAFLVFLAYKQLSKFKLVEDKTSLNQINRNDSCINVIIFGIKIFPFVI